ncbi:hypothetical protein CCP3SC15_1980003 [Gammaproteobacteria bacterium]
MGKELKREPFLSVSLPEDKKQELKKLAAKKGLKPGPFVRQMIYEAIEQAA